MWMIRSKGLLLHLRDGSGSDRPIYVIDDRREYPFERLPPGVDPDVDSDMLCRKVESLKGAKPAPTLAAHQKEQAKRTPKPTPKKAAEKAPEKQKPNLR